MIHKLAVVCLIAFAGVAAVPPSGQGPGLDKAMEAAARQLDLELWGDQPVGPDRMRFYAEKDAVPEGAALVARRPHPETKLRWKIVHIGRLLYADGYEDFEENGRRDLVVQFLKVIYGDSWRNVLVDQRGFDARLADALVTG